MKTRKILAALIAILAFGQGAWAAENGWTIQASTSGNVTTFTISRTNTAVAETVKYRFVNLSAYAGQHYNVTQVNGANSSALTGEFTFAAGETGSRTIQVTESAGSGAYSYYKDNTQRSYKLELTDAGGFYLTSNTRSFTTGTSINSSNVYAEKSVTVASGPVTITHDGFDQGYHAVSVATYFSNAAPQAYLVAAGAELRMVVTLDEAEKDDGYQHIQLLVNKTTSFDDNANEGNPGTPTNSHYLASFAHKPGSTLTTYASVCFPLTSATDNCSAVDPAWNFSPYNNTVGKLYTQKFKSGYRASDGKLIVAKKNELDGLSTVGIRFDASGDNADTWYAKNVTAKFTAVDVTAPTVIAYSVAPGRHSKGNTVYVSVAFSEIVTSSSAKLTSNWGDLSYVAGSGTNVLTFSRTIPASASSALNITGFSGITDLAGKAPSSVGSSNLCSLDDSYAYTITYDLDSGSADNPDSYYWETAAFTLNSPTKLGFYFDGWTGSNGSTPQTTVTIANHSHGNKSFTANWTQVWTGDGTQGDPYTITSTKGLDLLAQYVNSGNNCSELFFLLGSDITYTHTTAWDNAASTENNFTAIGNGGHPFQGTYDGGGHAISGIRIYKGGDSWADDYQGLFGNVSSGGTVRGVTLADARITGFVSIGGIAGHTFNSTIEDCTVGADVCIHAVQNSTDHGGIVGFNQANYVRRCISSATLTVANGLTGCKDFGGIVGNTQDTITDCIAEGAVIPDVKGRGAIVGYKYSGTLTSNYYHSCTVAGVANATGVGQGTSESSTETSDVNGAQALYSLTLPSDVTLSRTASPSATLPGTGNATYTTGADISGVPYAFEGASLTLSYSNLPDGRSVIYKVNGTAIDGNSFTMPAQDVTITAQLSSTVSYIDADGTEKSAMAIPITESQTEYGTLGETNWYVVSGEVNLSKLRFWDDETLLILEDGARLTINRSEEFGDGALNAYDNITIYGQSNGTGQLVVIDESFSKPSGIEAQTIIINSGNIIVSSNKGLCTSGSITINGGSVTATGFDANGSGLYSNSGITINGGSVIASGRYGEGNGIFAGSSIVINGGSVKTSVDRGIYGRNVTITDGDVEASGTSYGIYANGGNITIDGGNVEAISTESNGHGIYAQSDHNSGGTITINGGNVKASSTGSGGCGIYAGTITISGGIVEANGGNCGINGKTITLAGGTVTASKYSGTIRIQSGLRYTDGTTIYTGQLSSDQRTAIAGKTMAPYVAPSPDLTLVQGTKDGVTAFWGTFYDSGSGYTLPAGAAAYTMDAEYHLYRLGTDGSVIPKGTAVVIMADQATISLTTSDDAQATDNAPGGNILVGRDVATSFDSFICVLGVNASGAVGFYPLSGIALPAHKAGYVPKGGLKDYHKEDEQQW